MLSQSDPLSPDQKLFHHIKQLLGFLTDEVMATVNARYNQGKTRIGHVMAYRAWSTT